MIGRPLLQLTSSMMMVALFLSQRRSSATARFEDWTSGQVVGLDWFPGRLFSGKKGGFQANYMVKILRQRSLRTWAIHDICLGVIFYIKKAGFCRYNNLPFLFTANVNALIYVEFENHT